MQEILEQVLGILREVWRHRWLALGVAWVICLLAWPVILMLPDKYEARARVFVDPSTALRPVIQGLAIEQDVNAELNLVRQSLMSRPHLEKILHETSGLEPREKTSEAEARAITALGSRIDIAAVSPGNDNAPS